MMKKQNPLEAAYQRELRAQTVVGQILSCPPGAVEAFKRLTHKWEVLTGKKWKKEGEKTTEEKGK